MTEAPNVEGNLQTQLVLAPDTLNVAVRAPLDEPHVYEPRICDVEAMARLNPVLQPIAHEVPSVRTVPALQAMLVPVL
jgi:hypothetical protein